MISDRLRRLALRGGEGTSLVCLLGCGSLQEPEIVKHCEKSENVVGNKKDYKKEDDGSSNFTRR